MIAWLASVAWAQEPLSVDAAVALSQTRSPNVDQTELAARIAAVAASRARLDRFVATVGVQGGASQRWTVPLVGTEGSDTTLADWDVRATGGIPVYQGGAIAARIDQSAIAAENAQVAARITARDIARAVVSAYWNIQGFELQIQATEEALAVTSDALAIIEARAASGLAAPTDVNRSRVDVVSQQAQILDLENARYQARQELARLLSRPSDDFVLTDPVPPLPEGTPVPVTSGDGAGRLELAQRNLTVDEAAAGVRLARSAALPAVQLQADLGFGAAAVSGGLPGLPSAPLDAADLAPQLDVGAGVGLSWTPFDLFRTRQNVEIARLGVQQAEAARRFQEDVVRQEIRAAVRQLEVLRARAGLVAEQLRLARENLEIIQALYGQGNTSILELFQVQSQFRAARAQAANLAVDLVTAEWDVRFALGTDPITLGETP